WITANNRALLLDFVPPGNTGGGERLIAPNRQTPNAPTPGDMGEAQRFLRGVAEHALVHAKGSPQPPLPLHAQQFLKSLSERRIETAEILLGYLQSLLSKAAEVTRGRRLATVGLTLVPAGLLALAILTG